VSIKDRDENGLRSSPFITFSICCNLKRDRHKKISGGSYH